jgi:hypothetical protein
VPLVVCVLRGLPFLVTQLPAPSLGEAWLPVAYIPKDFMQYVAMVRQVPDQHRLLFVNPFTTSPQDGRFALPFFALLGGVSWLTRLDPFWTLELSRIPLLFLFFRVLAWFVSCVYEDPTRQRGAYLLVGLSGGLEFLAKLALPWLPAATSAVVDQDLWSLQGWSTFGAVFNPLWIAGLTLALLALEPILDPVRDLRARRLAGLALSVFALHWIHPYSEFVVLAVAAVRPLAAWALAEPVDLARTARIWAALAAPLALDGAIALWQLRDPVFAASSQQMLGAQQLPVFWYPLTFALVGAFALRGFALLAREHHPWRTSLVAWIAAIVFLHTSPIVNGYHFVFQLHLPIAIVAAPAAVALATRLTAARQWLAATALALGLFVSPLAITWESLADVSHDSRVPRAWIDASKLLGAEPAGNVLAPWQIGNLIPAYGPHRVYVGHWFLTPDFGERARRYVSLVGDSAKEPELRDLVDRDHIQYLVAAGELAPRLATALGTRVKGTRYASGIAILVLTPGGSLQ